MSCDAIKTAMYRHIYAYYQHLYSTVEHELGIESIKMIQRNCPHFATFLFNALTMQFTFTFGLSLIRYSDLFWITCVHVDQSPNCIFNRIDKLKYTPIASSLYSTPV